MACKFDFETLSFSEVAKIYLDEVEKLRPKSKFIKYKVSELKFLALRMQFEYHFISRFEFRIGVYKYLMSRNHAK